MKTYNVRLEFDVVSTDFADVEVKANSTEEALAIAIDRYHNDDSLDLDYYASNYLDTTLSHSPEDWEVNEL